MSPHQSEFGMFIPETAEMPEPLDDLNDLEAVANAIALTLIALDYKMNIDQLDIFEFYVAFTITFQDGTDLEKDAGKIFTGLATSLNTREFTLKAPVEDTTDQVVITLPREILIDESEPTFWEILKSLFDGGNWRV